MSYNEYNDMFLKCQDTGKYHVFTFDIKDSKKMDKKTRTEAQINLIKLAKLNYKMLEYIEKQRNTKILLKMENKSKYRCGFTQFDPEPIIIGDLTYFTILRDSLSREEVLEIFNNCKDLLDIDYEFHYADGFYETNDWCEGKNKYFRGYCIQLLSELHKPHNAYMRKLIKRK